MPTKDHTTDWLTQTWTAFSDILFRFIVSRVDTKEDAEDILQEVFIKTHLNIDKFDKNTNLNAWLFTITRNTITDYYRSKKKGYEFDDTIANTLFEETNSSTPPAFCCLEPHINELPEKYRTTIYKSEILGMKHQDIANEMGVSLSAIKSQVVRGRELLKEKFVSCCKYHLNEEGKLSGDPDCARPDCNH
jgi:RNA polymerase sigma-70 factor (ECF subfamily)